MERRGERERERACVEGRGGEEFFFLKATRSVLRVVWVCGGERVEGGGERGVEGGLGESVGEGG